MFFYFYETRSLQILYTIVLSRNTIKKVAKPQNHPYIFSGYFLVHSDIIYLFIFYYYYLFIVRIRSFSYALSIFELLHEKTYANKKDAEQPAHPRSLIGAFVVLCLDRVIPKVALSKFQGSILTVAEQASLSLIWSQTLEDRFSRDVAHVSPSGVPLDQHTV